MHSWCGWTFRVTHGSQSYITGVDPDDPADCARGQGGDVYTK